MRYRSRLWVPVVAVLAMLAAACAAEEGHPRARRSAYCCCGSAARHNYGSRVGRGAGTRPRDRGGARAHYQRRC